MLLSVFCAASVSMVMLPRVRERRQQPQYPVEFADPGSRGEASDRWVQE